MFKILKTPHKKFIDYLGTEHEPVSTLTDKYGGIAHISIDDNCYVCFLFSADLDGFIETHYIFPELHEALTKLPLLEVK
jgi:hypothetical protein